MGLQKQLQSFEHVSTSHLISLITIPSRKHWWLHPRQVSPSLALLLPSPSPPPARTYWGGVKIILSDLLEALLQPGTWRTSQCTTWESSPPTDWETPTFPKSSTSTSRQLVSRNLNRKKICNEAIFCSCCDRLCQPEVPPDWDEEGASLRSSCIRQGHVFCCTPSPSPAPDEKLSRKSARISHNLAQILEVPTFLAGKRSNNGPRQTVK